MRFTDMRFSDTKPLLLAGASHWLWLSLLIVVLDQVTKQWVSSALQLFERVPVLPIFDIVYLRNEGAAFSLLAGASGWQRWFFVVLAAAVSTFLVLWLRRLPPRGETRLAVGLVLILGGALGNAIDRLFYGYVVDFLYFYWGQWYFPAFNVADTAITLGAALLILDAVQEMRRERRSS